METAAAMRDFLKDGIIRNAVNFPSVSAGRYPASPFIELGERLGAFLAQMMGALLLLGVRYYGELAEGRNDMIVNACWSACSHPSWNGDYAGQCQERRLRSGHRSHRIAQQPATHYTSLISVKLHTSEGDVGLKVPSSNAPEARALDGIGIEAPLGGTMIVIRNNDQPGVIGEIGTILGRHGVNIANFALGRSGSRAVGVVIVDETAPISAEVLADLRKVKAIQEARILGLKERVDLALRDTVCDY